MGLAYAGIFNVVFFVFRIWLLTWRNRRLTFGILSLTDFCEYIYPLLTAARQKGLRPWSEESFHFCSGPPQSLISRVVCSWPKAVTSPTSDLAASEVLSDADLAGVDGETDVPFMDKPPKLPKEMKPPPFVMPPLKPKDGEGEGTVLGRALHCRRQKELRKTIGALSVVEEDYQEGEDQDEQRSMYLRDDTDFSPGAKDGRQ